MCSRFFILLFLIFTSFEVGAGQVESGASQGTDQSFLTLANRLENGPWTISRISSGACGNGALAGFTPSGVPLPPQFAVAAMAKQAIYMDSDPFPRHVPILDRILIRLHILDPSRFHSKQWDQAVEALKASGYRTLNGDDWLRGTDCLIAIPSQYEGDADEVDAQLDYALTDDFVDYFRRREKLKDELAAAQKELAAAQSDVQTLQGTLGALKAQVADEQRKVDLIQTAVDKLNYALFRFGLSGQPAYDKDDDFLREVIQRSLSRVPPEIAVDPKVPDAYLVPELIEAIRNFVAKNQEQLSEWGLSDFVLISVARTPLNQLSLQGDRPVVAGIFASGHVFGVAFDFQIGGSAVDIKSYVDNNATPDEFEQIAHTGATSVGGKPARQSLYSAYLSNPGNYRATFNAKLTNWNRLAALLKQSGLSFQAGIKDANHVSLEKFLSKTPAGKLYANQVRQRMLGGYLAWMAMERARLDMGVSNTKTQTGKLLEAKLGLNQSIQELQTQLIQLQQRYLRLQAQLAAKESERSRHEGSGSGRGPGGYRDRDVPDAGPQSRGPGPSDPGGHQTAPERDPPDHGDDTAGKGLGLRALPAVVGAHRSH